MNLIDQSTLFAALAGMQSREGAPRVAASIALLDIAEGGARAVARKARAALVAAYGEDALRYGPGSSGCCAPEAVWRVCEAAGLECDTCPWSAHAERRARRGAVNGFQNA